MVGKIMKTQALASMDQIPDIGCGLAALVHRNAIGDRVVIRRHDLQALKNDFAKACSALRNPVQLLSEIGGRLVSRPG